MTLIVWSFQCALVFLVPAVFGWILLRRVVREQDLSVLVPGSVVAGFAGLMTLINELRYWLEFGPATWFAYKLLIAATLALLIGTRAPRSRPLLRPDVRAPWKIALALAGAAVTAVYFGIPASAGFLNDAWWGHLPIAQQIQTVERFPLTHPFALDDPLYYHFGPDILAATWSHLLDVSVARGFALNIMVFSAMTFLLGFALALRISKRFWAALFAGCLVVVGGNLRFLNLIGADLSNPAARLRVFNSQTIQGLLQMVFTPSHAVGIPVTLLVLLMLRPFLARPSWLLATALGLLLGAVSLCAEWYFLPLLVTVVIILALRFWQGTGRRHLAMWIAVPVVAVAVGLYNNTYVAGMLAHFWMRTPTLASHAHARWMITALDWDHNTAGINASDVNTSGLRAKSVRPDHYVPPPSPVAPFGEAIESYVPQTWTPPAIVPLRLNLRHFGYVPSWESAGSNDSTWVPTWGWAFLSELFPVLGFGLPFGLWLWQRTRDPQVLALLILTIVSTIPPLLFDWGFRSTDFLRFFTGAFSFAAVLAGLLIGWLLAHFKTSFRLSGGVIAGFGLANAAGLGILGLMPATLETAKNVSTKGLSLSQVAQESKLAQVPPAASPSSAPTRTAIDTGITQEAAFQKLAQDLDHVLFPLTQGRDRAIVIVPPEQLPPLVVFPEWMKLAAMSHLLLPVGWYWNDSPYATYYRYAVLTLNSQAVAGVGARWVIVTNLWGYEPPAAVTAALGDHRRFVPAATLKAGGYYLVVYRIYN